MRSFQRFLPSVVLLAATFPPGALANPFASGPTSAYVPRVPISALARPVSAFDPSRLRVSSLVSVGSGWGGGAQALQVTSFSYRFDAPVEMRVSLGNAWGSQVEGRSAFFLEGVDVAFRPSANTFFQIQYQDRRSPLQYDASPFFAPYGFR